MEIFRFSLLGLGAGGLYALAAIGLVLVYRGSGVVNFAQVAIGMVGAYVFFELRVNHGFDSTALELVALALGPLLHAALVVLRGLAFSPRFLLFLVFPVLLVAVESIAVVARRLAALVGAVPRGRRALELVGLPDRGRHVPDELSGGERQRVTIARALVNDPAIVWADEPTGDLDSENADEIVALMRQLNREHDLTFLIVTHDIGVGRKTDRIVRMVDGRIVDEQILEVPK